MNNEIVNGTKKTIEGKPCVYYDGYWIRWYEIQSDDLAIKKKLIDQLTRRVFHHAEPGINAPGYRLDEIRNAYEGENDPARKRVKGAMLAGAMLNRGSDILTSIVDLQEAGVKLETSSQLLRECGQCFMEALELGKNIKLYNGGEGLDELWGEPFKVFSMSMEKYYESRYIKVAQTMSEIDKITDTLILLIRRFPALHDANSIITELCKSAKLACETIRSDPAIIDIWPRYVAAKEALEDFIKTYTESHLLENGKFEKKIIDLIREGGTLLISLATVRVPMPLSTTQFLQKCQFVGDFTG
jgi:hypothetical protein